VEYDVDERDGVLYIHTNDTHENFRLATAPLPIRATGPR
jgi:oligopeptidase B